MPVPNRLFDEMPEISDAALRCLLGLFRLSFRFDPKESQWTCPKKWLSRKDLQEETGLSDEGTRKGLSRLVGEGWAVVDQSAQAHRWRLRASVPTRRFTYVPTGLLSRASDLTPGTALRTALVVLRETWGWTHARENAPTEEPHGSCREEGSRYVHRRWARLSYGDLAQRTGRSETAVKEAAEALQGRWLCRQRPGGGPFFYRFRPKALTPNPPTPNTSTPNSGRKTADGNPPESALFESVLLNSVRLESPPSENAQEGGTEEGGGAPANKSPDGASFDPLPTNELAGGSPTEWHPPPFIREFLGKDKHSARDTDTPPSQQKTPGSTPGERSVAMPSENNTKEDSSQTNSAQKPAGDSPDFQEFSERKQALGRKLVNAGVWPSRAKECLHHYSARRIETNFNLWRGRKNASDGPTITDDGAWLCAAITDGYANLSNGEEGEESGRDEGDQSGNERNGNAGNPEQNSGSAQKGRVPKCPDHKEKVSARQKQTLIRHRPEIRAEHFHRFRHGKSPGEKQFLYFDPEKEGPSRQRSPRRTPVGKMPE